MTRGRKGVTNIETNQGYEILQAVTFTNGQGYALGHNPKAPDPFVTWRLTENEDGTRDYNWGHYFTNGDKAAKDLTRRAKEYKEQNGVSERKLEQAKEDVPQYRYYSTQRPVDLGTFPKPPGNAPVAITNYDCDARIPVAGEIFRAWGELTYAKPLTEKQMDNYKLKPAKDNPDRAKAPSITAQLKEAASRAEPPREHHKPHKSHEDR